MKIQEITQLVLSEIDRLRKKNDLIIVAIDGRCASGKTTLAEKINSSLLCNIFHMDDFFLRPEQRTQKRYEEPGGNVDRERFYSEVLQPLSKGKPFEYRPFDCHTMTLSAPVSVTPKAVNIVEGTYSCHPELWDNYVLRIFLTVSPKEQLLRIERRNGADIAAFKERWIPLEERYFSAYKTEENCDLHIETDFI